VAGIITSQGRAVIVCGVVVVLAYALMTATSRRGLATVVGVAAVAAVALFAVRGIIGSSQQAPALRYQGLTATHILQTTNQARGKSFARIPETLVNYPLGAGLGIAGPASGVKGAPALAGVADAENEISFATLETGIPGMLVVIGFTVILFAVGLRRCRHEPNAEARLLLAAIIAPLAGMLSLYTVSAITPTTPAGPYLWAAGGIVSYWLITRPAALRRAVASSVATV
jgi:O-antigen ligase